MAAAHRRVDMPSDSALECFLVEGVPGRVELDICFRARILPARIPPDVAERLGRALIAAAEEARAFAAHRRQG